MRSDQLCLNCEWWDDRDHVEGFDPKGEKFLCLRWPEVVLRTGGGQRCWQWAKKAVDPGSEELVSETGSPTGHVAAGINCADWIRVLQEEITEQRRVAIYQARRATGLKARWDRARRLLYQVCMSGLNNPPEDWNREVRQLLREGLLRAESDG